MMSLVQALTLVRFLKLAWSHLMSLKVVPPLKSLYLIQSRIPTFQVQLFLLIFLAEFLTSFLLNFNQLLCEDFKARVVVWSALSFIVKVSPFEDEITTIGDCYSLGPKSKNCNF